MAKQLTEYNEKLKKHQCQTIEYQHETRMRFVLTNCESVLTKMLMSVLTSTLTSQLTSGLM